MTHTTIPPRALILLAILTLVWGTNWPLFPYAVREVSVWTFRATAVTFAGLLLLGVAAARGQSLRLPRRHWRTVCVATFFYLILWNVCSTYSALMIASGQAAILGFTMPLWSALIASLVLGEKMSRRLQLALLLGATAVALLMWPGLTAYAQAPLGFALGLLAGLGWAVGSLILKRYPVNVPITVLTGWQLLIAGLPLAIGAFALGDHQWFMPSWPTVAVIGYITLMPMSLGNVCWFAIAGLLPVNVAGLSAILVPVVAMLSGALVHGEPLGPIQWAAMACCALALSLVILQPKPRTEPSRAP